VRSLLASRWPLTGVWLESYWDPTPDTFGHYPKDFSTSLVLSITPHRITLVGIVASVR
jgi:hypothetical protein